MSSRIAQKIKDAVPMCIWVDVTYMTPFGQRVWRVAVKRMTGFKPEEVMLARHRIRWVAMRKALRKARTRDWERRGL